MHLLVRDTKSKHAGKASDDPGEFIDAKNGLLMLVIPIIGVSCMHACGPIFTNLVHSYTYRRYDNIFFTHRVDTGVCQKHGQSGDRNMLDNAHL